MKKIFGENSLFFILYALYAFFVGLLLLFTKKEAAVWWFNGLHSPAPDFLFSYLTHLGDGFFCVLLAILLFFRSRYWGLGMLVGFGLVSGLVQFLKRIVFTDFYRPYYFYKNLHLVEGVKIYEYNSFPSGHSATAWFSFALLSFFLPKRYAFLFFVLALIASLSRVYLAQHFLIDTYVGSILGILVAIFSFWYQNFLFENKKLG